MKTRVLHTALVAVALFAGGCASTPEPTKTPLEIFQEGEELSRKGHYEDAIAQWKKVKESFRSPELSAMAELKIADAHFENKSYIESAAAYEDFRKLHPAHEKAPYALFRAGLSQYLQIEGIDRDQTAVKNAAAAFESYLALYPKGTEAEEVRQKLEDSRSKMAAYEIYVGRFYLRSGKYASAIGRLEDMLKKYPEAAGRDEALALLGTARLRNGEADKGREAFQRLFRDFPQSRFVEEAKKTLEKEY